VRNVVTTIEREMVLAKGWVTFRQDVQLIFPRWHIESGRESKILASSIMKTGGVKLYMAGFTEVSFLQPVDCSLD